MDNGVNRPRGSLLSTLALHFQPQLAYNNQPKWRVVTDVLHLIMTASVAVNRMLKATTGRDCRDVHCSMLQGNLEGDLP